MWKISWFKEKQDQSKRKKIVFSQEIFFVLVSCTELIKKKKQSQISLNFPDILMVIIFPDNSLTFPDKLHFYGHLLIFNDAGTLYDNG